MNNSNSMQGPNYGFPPPSFHYSSPLLPANSPLLLNLGNLQGNLPLLSGFDVNQLLRLQQLAPAAPQHEPAQREAPQIEKGNLEHNIRSNLSSEGSAQRSEDRSSKSSKKARKTQEPTMTKESAPTCKQSSIETVRKLTKERDDLSAALQASNDEVDRLRAVVAQISESDGRGKSEDETDDSSHAQRRYWNEDEHQRFLEGLSKYGPKSVKAISVLVQTRTPTQVRTHAQKYFQKLARTRTSSKGSASDELSGLSTETCDSSTEKACHLTASR